MEELEQNNELVIEFIVKTFSNILMKNVRVINMSDDEIGYSIYDLDNYNNQYDKLSDENLAEYEIDYGICKVKNNKWIYLIGFESGGSYNEPPYYDILESINVYDSFKDALFNLVMNITNEKINDIYNQIFYERTGEL